jgi:cytochrome c
MPSASWPVASGAAINKEQAMKTWTKWLFAGATALGLMAGAQAQERGTKDEAKAMVDAAFEYIKKVGPEKANKDFTSDKAAWTKKDLYVFVYDGKGVALAHGANEKMVGKDLSQLKDVNGVPIIGNMLSVANKAPGTGWVDYDWADPLTKKVAPKTTYVRKAPGGDGFIGVGIYR